jgi:hypothetical protein
MDERRMQLVNDIKQTLIELNHIILESYVNENCYSIDYEIMTDKNNVVLSVKIFYENGNILFDEFLIYDYDGNNLLVEIPLNEKHSSKEIYEIFLSHFKSSNV